MSVLVAWRRWLWQSERYSLPLTVIVFYNEKNDPQSINGLFLYASLCILRIEIITTGASEERELTLVFREELGFQEGSNGCLISNRKPADEQVEQLCTIPLCSQRRLEREILQVKTQTIHLHVRACRKRCCYRCKVGRFARAFSCVGVIYDGLKEHAVSFLITKLTKNQ